MNGEDVSVSSVSFVGGSVASDNVENSNVVVNGGKELVLVNSICPNMDMPCDSVM